MATIGVGIYSIEAGGYNVFDFQAREYFQTLHRNEDIYDLKGVHIATFEPHLFSSNVEHYSISNVNSYQCSCKQCCPIAVYAMCYSLLLNLVDTGLKELYLPLLVTGIHRTM